MQEWTYKHIDELEIRQSELKQGQAEIKLEIQELKKELNLKSAHKAWFVLPSLPTHFAGREKETEMVLSILEAPGGSVSIIGAGGLGKSGLMSKVVHLLEERGRLESLYPDGVIHIDFYNEPRIESALNSIITQLGDTPEGNRLEQTKRLLSRKTLLLLLDGTEAIAERPQPYSLSDIIAVKGKNGAIITSRRIEDTCGTHCINLSVLSIEESIDLFMNLAGGNHNKESMRRICEMLGGHVLVVRLAARYIGKIGMIEKYEEWLRNTPFAEGGALDSTAANKTGKTVWHIS